MSEDIENIIEEKINQYNEMLKDFDEETIKTALQYLRHCKTELRENRENGINKNFSIDISVLDEQTQSLFKLMNKLRDDIKTIYVESNCSLTYITPISPENMEDGKIKISQGRLNNYETEMGDWVFASSEPADGRNAYIARQENGMMIRIGKFSYVYGDEIDIVTDDEDNSRAVLKKPNYVYEISPDNFFPVVTLKDDREGNVFFEFSKEWISEKDVDISDKKQVLGVKKLEDVTDLLDNYHVFCDTRQYNKEDKPLGIIVKERPSREEAKTALADYIQSGDIRYINSECGINVDEEYEKRYTNISGRVVENFSKIPEVQEESENAEEIIDGLTNDEREGKTNARSKGISL